MNTLAPRMKRVYAMAVPENSGAGRDNPMTRGALALLYGAFFIHGPSSMAGDAGQIERSGRVSRSRIITPASFATLVVINDLANSNLSTWSPYHV